MAIEKIQKRLRQFASREKAKVLRGFFKTGPGEYGEGDLFLGVAVPDIRKVAKEFCNTPLNDVLKLLSSQHHEERLLALLMLTQVFDEGDESLKRKIFGLYLGNTRFINNWDLVDISAPNIVGAWLVGRSRKPLHSLANSRDLWKRRISILSTLAFIRQNDFNDALMISRILLTDKHDLIHKAVGWMLREIGKRDRRVEEEFLMRHYRHMPRTMLRYAIERFPERLRKSYLNGVR
ncbi:MAG TPA: DNA alkylation repair protein [Nitrospirota bacterium]|nr:DNA alkylation repair protein [Nitrospirota bacterium]